MNKPICIFQAPVATRSGYGDMSRDLARHLIELDIFDLKIISTPWGSTPVNALNMENPIHEKIIQHTVFPPLKFDKQPEVFIQVTIPQEFQGPAKVNIGITAGIETNMCSEEWLKGCNRMTTVWGISEHAVRSLATTQVKKQDQNGNVIEEVKATVPFEVLNNYIDTDVYKKIPATEIDKSIDDLLLDVKEKFCFLFVGHWLKGGIGEDRKNIGVLIQTFCETFKGLSSERKPALILKTSGADFSILDREDCLRKIKEAKEKFGIHAPNVYLIHGDLSPSEMNSLYNHPKIKVHVSFTKGEGFGRPLLEASMSEKPIVASGWSGHLDFLNPVDSILLAGELKQIEKGAVWDNVLIPQSSWFNVDVNFASKALRKVFESYSDFLPPARRLAKTNREKFESDKMKEKLKVLLEKYVPDDLLNPPKLVPIALPKLMSAGNITLPTLKKPGDEEKEEDKPTLPTLKRITLKKNEETADTV